MKLKAPKTWQMVVIFVAIVLLAIGGGVLYVYLSTGFQEQVIYPDSISIEDANQTYNSSLQQYEAVEDFNLTITTPTENVNRRQITLSFASGVAFTRDEEAGTISDGVITVPENVILGQEFRVSLVKQAYTTDGRLLTAAELENYEGEVIYLNAGGISNLMIATQNNTRPLTSIQIAVDVPVLSVTLRIVDATTGLEFTPEAEGEPIKIPEGTNFVVEPVFLPEASRYQFSDNQNSTIAEANKREKGVYFSLASSTTGIEFNYNDGDVYFTALDEISASNTINAYLFPDSLSQRNFLEANSSLQDLALYNEIVSALSLNDEAIQASISHAVVEANVGSFLVANDTAQNPYALSENKLLRIYAGAGEANLDVRIADIHGNSLSGLVGNVAARLISATNNEGTDMRSSVVLRGGTTQVVDGVQYTFINSAVKNLNYSYFELSSNQAGNIQFEIVLLVQDENGEYFIFGQPETFYATVTATSEQGVSWSDMWTDATNGISMQIIYSGTQAVSSQYERDLETVSTVPAENTYQRKVFFIYSTATDNPNLANYAETTSFGQGSYSVGGAYVTLYPLSGSELIAKMAGNYNLIFATVRTDAYGTPIMEEDGRYILEQISSPVSVSVTETLRGIQGATVVVNDDEQNWLEDNRTEQPTSLSAYAIPTGYNLNDNTPEAKLSVQILLLSGDGNRFMDELNDGDITFFASTRSDGSVRAGNVFNFNLSPDQVIIDSGSRPGYDVVTIYFGINNVTIENAAGQNYYLFVEYNNSIEATQTMAEIGGDDVNDCITVYNQETQTIISEDLAGQAFAVEQTLTNDGTSSVVITGGNITGSINTNEFNEYFNGIVFKDYYGRAFASSYTLSSSDPQLVEANSTTHNLSFLNGEGNATITVSAGSARMTFTFEVSSMGISGLAVLGSYSNTNLASASYTYTNGQGTTLQLKNPGTEANNLPNDPTNGILTVFVGGDPTVTADRGQVLDPTTYNLTFTSDTLSGIEKNQLDAMLTVTTTDGEQVTFAGTGENVITQNTPIESIAVKNDFGTDLMLTFNARNADGSVNFAFTLTIAASATKQSDSLNQVKYWNNSDEAGVRGHDSSSGRIGVYAGFGISLNAYLLVSDGSDNPRQVDWGAVYEGRQDIVVNDQIVGYIEQGVIVFNDVTTPQEYNITLYAVPENNYGYHETFNFTVYPNFEISPSSDVISLSNIASAQTGYSYSNIFGIERITTLTREADSNIGTFTFNGDFNGDGLIARYEIVDANNVEYLAFDSSNNITRTSVNLLFEYGDPSKPVVLKGYDANGNLVVEQEYNLTLGLTWENLQGKNFSGDITAIRLYDGSEVAVMGTEFTFATGSENNLTVSMSSVSPEYCYQTSGQNSYSFKSQSSAVAAGENIFISLAFSYGNSLWATWRAPVLISWVGGNFASYGEANEDLKLVFEGGYEKEITAGGTYNLLGDDSLTGLEEGMFGEGSGIRISFAYVGDLANSPFISVSENGEIEVKNYAGSEPLIERIRITLRSDTGPAFSYDYVLRILPNISELGSVTYPFDGLGTEHVTVDDEQTINLDSAFGANTQHSGATRFPDGKGYGVGTYAISEVRINDKVVSNYGPGADFEVSLNGSELTFKNNANVSNVEVIISKTYGNLYGHTFSYSFSINSNDITYGIVITAGDNLTYTPETQTFAFSRNEGQTDYTFSINTQQTSGGGTSDIPANVVVTHNFSKDSKDWKVAPEAITSGSGTVTITSPEFIGQDGEYEIYLTINGVTTITYKVNVYSTVKITWTPDRLTGGRKYDILGGIIKNVDGLAITDVTIDYPDGGKVGFITTDREENPTTLTVEPIYGEELTATVTIGYSYNGNTGSTSKTLIFEPNLTAQVKSLGNVYGEGDEQPFNISEVLSVLSGGLGDGTYALTNPTYSSNLIKSFKLTDTTITLVAQNINVATYTQVEFRLTYKKGDYSFTTDTLRVTLTVQPAAQVSANYPAPAGQTLANQNGVNYETIAYTTRIEGVASEGSADRSNGTITVNGQTFTYKYDSGSSTLTLSIAGDNNSSIESSNGKITINSVEYIVASPTENNNLILVPSVYANFFTSTADFASEQRIVFKNWNGGTGYNEPAETSPVKWGNFTVRIDTQNSDLNSVNQKTVEEMFGTNGTLSLTRASSGSGIARITFIIEYNGASTSYTVYVANNVISANTHTTINQTTEGYEEIYADKVSVYEDDDPTKTNLFAKNRLLQLSVDSSATAGTVYGIYARRADTSVDGYEYIPLGSFLMNQTYITNGTIYVDIGVLSQISSDFGDPANNLLPEGWQFVIGDLRQTISNEQVESEEFLFYSGVTVVGQASRVEYLYTLYNGDSVLITSDSLNIVESITEGSFGSGEETTFTVGYTIGESATPLGQTTYNVMKTLDITMDENKNLLSSSGALTVIEVITNRPEHYTLVDLAGLRHPSTGELISYESIAAGDVSLSIETVNTEKFTEAITDAINRAGLDINEFKDQVDDNPETPYLTYTDIAVREDNDVTVYDFYLRGEGTDNNGDYVLLRFSYSAGGEEEVYYMVIKLIPDYNVTINGTQVATSGTTTDAPASNEGSMHVFTPDGSALLNIATAEDSVVDFRSPYFTDPTLSGNRATSLTYKLTVLADGNGYNTVSNIGKLNLMEASEDSLGSSVAWYINDNPENKVDNSYVYKENDFYKATPNGSDLKLIPSAVIFGSKTYMLEITNVYGFTVHYYFVLTTATQQNPTIHSSTDTNYTEGEGFDVGVIYDLVSITETAEGSGKYNVAVSYDNVPSESSNNAIIIDNVDTWGISTGEYENISFESGDVVSGGSEYDTYLEGWTEKMTYQNVKVTGISFQYGDEEPISVGNNSYTLATEANGIYSYGGNTTSYRGIDENLASRPFTVPTLPGWYYGTGDSVSVTVRVTLQYSKGGDTETCEVSFTATINKQVSISSTGQYVVDGTGFAIDDYITASGGDASTTPTFYDDTLALTISSGGQVQVNVTLDGTTYSDSFDNLRSNSSYTHYVSLSDVVGRTLDPSSDTVTITLTDAVGTIIPIYAGSDISAFAKADGYTITWGSGITNDKLFLEDSERITNSEHYEISKSYIVGVQVDGETYYYRYNKTYRITSDYSFLNTGLGQSDLKNIDADANGNNKLITGGKLEPGSTGNYKIPIGVWSSGVKVGKVGSPTAFESGEMIDFDKAVGVVTVTFTYVSETQVQFKVGNEKPVSATVTAGKGTVTLNEIEYEFTLDGKKLETFNGKTVNLESGDTFTILIGSIYFVVSDSAGALATAYFKGTDLYTGAGYTIGSDQYIQIYIYVKAAGPKGGFANQSLHGYDKLLGGYRIRLI